MLVDGVELNVPFTASSVRCCHIFMKNVKRCNDMGQESVPPKKPILTSPITLLSPPLNPLRYPSIFTL